MEKIVSGAPRPSSACRVRIENRTSLPLTAVSLKWMLANQLAPGGVSKWCSCPSREDIEFQFAEPGTPYEDILWAQPRLEFAAGRNYRVVVSGGVDAPSFEVSELEE